MDNWKTVKTCSRSSNQKLKTRPIKDRRSEYTPFIAYYALAVRNIIEKFVPKKIGVDQLWVQNESMSMCLTREELRIQLKCNRSRSPLLWVAFVAKAQWLFSGFVVLLPSADRPKNPLFLPKSPIRYSNSVSPQLRACSLPGLPELKIGDMRLTDKFKKCGF